MKTIQLVIQECVVCQLQILDSRPLFEGKQEPVSVVALIIDADSVSVDHRLCQERNGFGTGRVVCQSDNNAVA